MQITSSAINNIAIVDDKVTVTFKGDRDYTYNCHDVAGFENDLNDVISEGESVGRFVNTAIRAQLLQAVWSFWEFFILKDSPIKITHLLSVA